MRLFFPYERRGLVLLLLSFLSVSNCYAYTIRPPSHSWSCFLLEPSQSDFENQKGEVEYRYSSGSSRKSGACFDSYYEEHQTGYPMALSMSLLDFPAVYNYKQITVKRLCKEGVTQTFEYESRKAEKLRFVTSDIPEECKGVFTADFSIKLRHGNKLRTRNFELRAPVLRVELSTEPHKTKLSVWQCSIVTAHDAIANGDEIAFKYDLLADEQTKRCIEKYFKTYKSGYLQFLGVSLDEDFIDALRLENQKIQTLTLGVTDSEGQTHNKKVENDAFRSYHVADFSLQERELHGIQITLTGKNLSEKWEYANSRDLRESWRTPRVRLLFRI